MRYRTIYADPPWNTERGGGKIKRGADRHYPLMRASDLLALPVGALADDDALLFLWSTVASLPLALELTNAWGFAYVTNRVWVKPHPGLGQWQRVQHEHLLLCRRGRVAVPPPALRSPSVTYAPRADHSRKPPEFRQWAEAIGQAPRLELFARTAAPGWTTLGNAIDGADIGDAIRDHAQPRLFP